MPPTTQIQIPFATIGGFTFNMQSLIAVDTSEYEQGAEGRHVLLCLLGPIEHVFREERADAAYLWWLGITGQSRIQAVEPIGAPGSLGGQ